MDKRKELEFLLESLSVNIEKDNLSFEEIKETLLIFKSAVDLSWFIIKNELEEKCLIPQKISPRDLYRLAKDFKIINNIDDWLEMYKTSRQILISNDENEFRNIYEITKNKYITMLKKLI